MCGICGVYPQNENTQVLLPLMVWDIERRGYQSWGAMDDQRILIKKVGPVCTSGFKLFPEAASIVYHTRQASQGAGAITEENTHPFEFTGSAGVVRGVHNGMLSNDCELNTKYNKTYAVDSMHIFDHLADGKDLSELDGWGTAVWYKNNVLHFAKLTAHADLGVGRLQTGEIIFSSELSTIVRAAAMVGNEMVTKINVEKNKVYTITTAPIGIVEVTCVGDLNFGRDVQHVPHIFSGWDGVDRMAHDRSQSYYGNYSEDKNSCNECEAVIDGKKQIVCKDCFKKIITAIRQRGLQRQQIAEVIIPGAQSYVAS